MANNNKLKAFVRYDGSGRVVPSSLILARFKPKVGNYKEIDAYECCNGGGGAPGNYLVNIRQLFEDGTCGGIDIVTNYPVTSSNPVIVGKWYTEFNVMRGLIAVYIVSAGGPGEEPASIYTDQRNTCNT
jgi:hypothetical protein